MKSNILNISTIIKRSQYVYYNLQTEKESWLRRVWISERGNHKGQRTKDKKKKNKRSTKHSHKTKDRVTRTPLKPGGELRCSGRVSSSCSTSGTCWITLVTTLMVSHKGGKDREVLRQVEYICDHLWYIYSVTVKQVMVATVKLSKLWFQLNQ